MVSQGADDMRKVISPGARLLHSYRAASDFEAFRAKNAWLGFELWRPEPDWEERFHRRGRGRAGALPGGQGRPGVGIGW